MAGAKVQPFLPVRQSGLLSLISTAQTVAASQYGASVPHPLAFDGDGSAALHSGKIDAVILHSGETGSGAIRTPVCHVLFFNGDPLITAGATTLTLAQHRQLIGIVPIFADDWRADTGGATATVAIAVPYHDIAIVGLAVFLAAGTPTYNAGAGDDELLDVRIRYGTDS